MDHSPLEFEVITLRAENATLQTEIAELRIRMNAYQQAWNSDELEKRLSVENAALEEQVAQQEDEINHLKILIEEQDAEWASITSATVFKLKETIAQQAAVIEQMREALSLVANRFIGWHTVAEQALALQPSPEILQARDEKVAEACANLVNRFISGDGILNDTWVHEIEDAIRSGEWRKYL